MEHPPGTVIGSMIVEPGSAYAMTREARSVWQQSFVPVPVVDALRYSITFRSVR